MTFTMACYPGPGSWVSYQHRDGLPMLVLQLDPGLLEIQLPPFPDGQRVLARLCREMCQEAAMLATSLGAEGPRHRLIDPHLATDESGGGF